MLDKAVKTYKTTMRKSFNKYFDLILKRRFIYLCKKEQKVDYAINFLEEVDYLRVEEEEKVGYDISILLDSDLSELESNAFRKIILEGANVKEASCELKADERSIYNAVARAKLKLRKKLKKAKGL